MACTAESTPDCDDTKKAFRRSTPPSPNWPNSAGRNSTRASKVPRSALRSGRARVKSSSLWNSVRYAPVRSRPRARFSTAEDAGLFWAGMPVRPRRYGHGKPGMAFRESLRLQRTLGSKKSHAGHGRPRRLPGIKKSHAR